LPREGFSEARLRQEGDDRKIGSLGSQGSRGALGSDLAIWSTRAPPTSNPRTWSTLNLEHPVNPVNPANSVNLRDPFAVLGPHVVRDRSGASSVVIRTMQPAAQGVAVRLIASGDVRPMARVDREGLFEVHVPAENSSAAAIPAIPDYRLVIDFGVGQTI